MCVDVLLYGANFNFFVLFEADIEGFSVLDQAECWSMGTCCSVSLICLPFPFFFFPEKENVCLLVGIRDSKLKNVHAV